MTTNDDPFEGFLKRLEPQIASSAERYLRLRNKLIKFFNWRRCRDAEELADESIGRLLTRIYAGDRIDKPPSFIYGVALNVFKEDSRKAARLDQIEDDQVIAAGDFNSGSDGDPFVECARLCYEKLPDDKRRLLEQYYSDEGSRADLALRMGLTLAALRTRVHRLKADLKECYQRCVGGSGADSEGN
jgi:DNA-directed RNA polymerase specialized sigma24 family protein